MLGETKCPLPLLFLSPATAHFSSKKTKARIPHDGMISEVTETTHTSVCRLAQLRLPLPLVGAEGLLFKIDF